MSHLKQQIMSNTRLRKFVNGAGMIIGGVLLLAVYAVPFLVPMAISFHVSGVETNGGVTVELGIFIVLYVVMVALFAGIYQAIGLFDFENATGRVPPKR